MHTSLESPSSVISEDSSVSALVPTQTAAEFSGSLQDQLLQSAHAAAEGLLAESLTSALAKQVLTMSSAFKSNP